MAVLLKNQSLVTSSPTRHLAAKTFQQNIKFDRLNAAEQLVLRSHCRNSSTLLTRLDKSVRIPSPARDEFRREVTRPFLSKHRRRPATQRRKTGMLAHAPEPIPGIPIIGLAPM